MANLKGDSANPRVPGVYGENTARGDGVFGEGGNDGRGVVGVSRQHTGVEGTTTNGIAVFGGVLREGQGRGVVGVANTTTAVEGNSTSGTGVWGSSESGEAIHAVTKGDKAAIAAYNLHGGDGFAIFAKKEGTKGFAGFFDGNVWVGGELGVGKDIILANADCAEDFEIVDADLMDPGTVMVVGKEGSLHQSHQAYDKRVVGVISGAGDYKPGIVLDKQQSQSGRKPIALLGKVFCKVDASHAPVKVGDLLTTSDVLGHAMKAADPARAFGAVIGKALRPLKEGQGLIPILVALQ